MGGLFRESGIYLLCCPYMVPSGGVMALVGVSFSMELCYKDSVTLLEVTWRWLFRHLGVGPFWLVSLSHLDLLVPCLRRAVSGFSWRPCSRPISKPFKNHTKAVICVSVVVGLSSHPEWCETRYIMRKHLRLSLKRAKVATSLWME